MMPPKTERKKAAKGKKSSAVGKRSADERFKDQLEEHIVRLREELVREREKRSYFQLDRDKIQSRWEISRRRLEEEEAELRSRQREREEAQDRHQEITVYKVKLNHVLSEHHNAAFALKADAVASTVQVLSAHAQAELGLRRELHGLQAEGREKRFHESNGIKERQLTHQVELVELENSCDERVTEMEMKYHIKALSIIAADTKKQQDEVCTIEGRMESRVVTLIEEHDTAVQHVERYCNTHKKQLQDQKELKVKLAEVTRLKACVDKRRSAGEQENKRLSESLLENQQKLPELQKQLRDHQQASANTTAATKARVKARVQALDRERGDLSVGRVLLEQAFEKVQQECEELKQKQTEAILDTEQKSSLKHLLLQRKVAALTQTAEKKEAQLCAALSASNVDQTAASRAANKLQETLESKQTTINGLQCHLARGCTEYDDLLLTCKDKLKALGVPLYDFPFKRSKWILGGQTRVQDSAGPASKE